jgi:hypothetical protein
MAKAKAKEEGVPAGTKIIDLSAEKRGELYEEALKKFDAESVETYGYTLDVELVFNKKGVVPRMVKLDILTLRNEQAKQNKVQETRQPKE